MIIRRIINLFRPFHKGRCRNCNHQENVHRTWLIAAGYPGARCYGGGNWICNRAFCKCPSFEAMGNLDYLEYKAKEAGMI
jgi:hypothetical protein